MTERVRIAWLPPGGSLQLITLDAAVSERHSFNTAVTDHPVETGINVSDHLRPEPVVIEIKGIISNHPVTLLKDNADGVGEIQVEVSGPPATVGNTIGRPIPVLGALTSNIRLPLPVASGVVKGFDTPFDRVGNVFNQLLYIRTQGYLLDIFTTLRTYEGFAMTTLDVQRSANSANVLDFTISCKEIRIGSTQEVEAPLIPTARTNKGTKATIPVPATSEPPTDSTAFRNLFGSR